MPHKTTTERFWERVDVRTPAECWLWRGGKINSGYGVLSLGGPSGGPKVLAHRFSYEYLKGAVRDGVCVLHKCDVRLCVNPNHLFAGSHTNNSLDALIKGRRPDYKLSFDHADDIRALAASGVGRRELAFTYGVCRTTIANVCHGRIWNRP